MGCFFCSCGDSSEKRSQKDEKKKNVKKDQSHSSSDTSNSAPRSEVKKDNPQDTAEDANRPSVVIESDDKSKSPIGQECSRTKAQTFTFTQLVTATDGFNAARFLGEGGFGRVYRGTLADCDQIVAIKQLNPDGCQGIREFVVEVLTLSVADHPNLVKLIGYCAEGEQRLLVYEYMPLGSLDYHLHGELRYRKRLDWNMRMKIALGAARGLQYLHNQMNPAIIYRDLKCSNILLDEHYNPKLSDFGLAKVGPQGDKTHVSTRVMGTYGYCAPDYAMTGQLNFKSDVYSFGVVLLELVTGRKAMDNTKSAAEQNLVSWARPLLKDRKNFSHMADPALEGQYPVRGLQRTLAIAAICVHDQANKRPHVAEIVEALDFLASQKYDPLTHHPGESSRSG